MSMPVVCAPMRMPFVAGAALLEAARRLLGLAALGGRRGGVRARPRGYLPPGVLRPDSVTVSAPVRTWRAMNGHRGTGCRARGLVDHRPIVDAVDRRLRRRPRSAGSARPAR